MKFLFLVAIIFCSLKIHAKNYLQSDSIIEKEIITDPYRLFLTNNDHSFYSGSLQIFDKYNNSVFYEDSFYTRFNWDTLIDLNNDGSRELILDLGTGALMYDYNMFLIFDFKKSPEPLFEIHNAELITGIDATPKITSYVRLSPSVMGAGYIYSLKYENGRIVPEKDVKKSKVLKSFDIDEEDDLYFINEYEAGFDECAEDSEVKIYYYAYMMQQKILGQESKGWKFFDKHYKCRDRKKVKQVLIEDVNKNYEFISNPDNYKFSAEN